MSLSLVGMIRNVSSKFLHDLGQPEIFLEQTECTWIYTFQDMLTKGPRGIRGRTMAVVDGDIWTDKSTWTGSTRSMTRQKDMEVLYGAILLRMCMMAIAEGRDT